MADSGVDPRPEAMARQAAESLGYSLDTQSDGWIRSKVERYAKDLEAADKVDPLRQCMVPVGKPTALVHRRLFDSVLIQRDEARAELAALKKKLRKLSQS